jgi:formamidopyrimidine-DNA glycosylase
VPELPEIAAAVEQLAQAIAGRTILRLEVLHAAIAKKMPAKAASSLSGIVIAGVERRGKHQIVRLGDGRVIVAHFRLNGEWEVGRHDDPLPRFARAVLTMDDGTRVVLVDSRALSSLVLAATAEQVLPRMGPEADDPAFTADALGAALAKRRGPIKPVLLDQRVVAGLGNIYAAEALWLAKISPFAPASKLGPERRARLVRAIKDVLRRAPSGRYWMSDRVTNWRVYDREGQACKRCGGKIRRSAQGGRSTFHCPSCQTR